MSTHTLKIMLEIQLFRYIFELRNIGMVLDSTFVELPDDKPPVFLGLYLQVEESTQITPTHVS